MPKNENWKNTIELSVFNGNSIKHFGRKLTELSSFRPNI